MKRLAITAAILVVCGAQMVAMRPAGALAASSGWSTTDAGASVLPGTSPLQTVLHYDGSHAYTYYQDRLWTFTATATQAGTLNVPYVYSGCHSWFMTHEFLAEFVIHNGVKVQSTLVNAWVACGFSFSGTATFNVAAGDTYGFTVGGTNYDYSQILTGSITVTAPATVSLLVNLTQQYVTNPTLSNLLVQLADAGRYQAYITLVKDLSARGTLTPANAATLIQVAQQL
ncbi:MAG TPA: hypothetical protein VFB58_17595 [Chloroflexota bacterium]|nr:hypothetical protein [Chloroflexota bacterium]